MVVAAQKTSRRSPSLLRALWRNPFSVAVCLMLVGYWLTVGLVVAIDPYDLYPWGKVPQVETRQQPDKAMKLFAVAAKDRSSNFMLVGASTTMVYSEKELKSAFPDARNPWNLGYGGARPGDRDAQLQELVKAGLPRHIVISLDWTYALGEAEVHPLLDEYMYDASPLNDLRMVSRYGVLDALQVVRSGYIARNASQSVAADWAVRGRQYVEWHSPQRLAEIRRAIATDNQRLRKQGTTDCAAMTAITQQLVPAVRALSRQGSRVDILVPAYSPLMYYRTGNTRNQKFTTLSDQLLLRRCTVQLTADMPNVAIWAPDRDLSIIADFSRFNDPAHLYDRSYLSRVLAAVGDERYRLTPSNVDAYIAALKAYNIGYHLPSPRP